MTITNYLKHNIKKVLPRRSEYYKNLLTRRVSEKALTQCFIDLGVKEGQTVFVQSSMSNIGHLIDGPESFISALLKLIGPNGTLVMPAFSTSGSMLNFLKQTAVFDSNTTPSKSGLLTEAFRKMPGVVRSVHPTHSICAIGKNAKHLVTGHQFCETPCGIGTPFDKLIQLKAKHLRVGTGVCTFYHSVQEILGFPNLFVDGHFDVKCTNSNGDNFIVKTKCYTEGQANILFLGPNLKDAINPSNYPWLHGGDREKFIELVQPQHLSHLIELRNSAIAEKEYTSVVLKGCVYDLFDIKSYVDTSIKLQTPLLRAYKDKYNITFLERLLQNGNYPRKKI